MRDFCIPLPSIPDTLHAAPNGVLYRRAKQREKAVGKDAAEVLMEALGRMLAGRAQRTEASLATVMRENYPQRLLLWGQRLACKTSTIGMHLSVRQMGALSGVLPA